jgi:hypothetical protein
VGDNSDIDKAADSLVRCIRTMRALRPRLECCLETLEAAGWAGAGDLVGDDALGDMDSWTIPMAEGILACGGHISIGGQATASRVG